MEEDCISNLSLKLLCIRSGSGGGNAYPFDVDMLDAAQRATV
ncbi:hypothetical protein SJ05684_b54020 (plasmid) [Sinorhizobium sojae CCBAU 05684]|uniref:Uncharacterized protein n=1 Tax=Sinorhizobium sojae CCBAU 05684 TaxID=716928 RepID=A0A249PL14_9HYPH|nr:hypothetical protein SJ05684_b54020 [Sinorhizobium sojae CCBAU 05684]